jgi:hypothetical protein
VYASHDFSLAELYRSLVAAKAQEDPRCMIQRVSLGQQSFVGSLAGQTSVVKIHAVLETD